MEYTRTVLSRSPFKNPRNVTCIWGTDGWRYIPQLHIRDKFTPTHYTRETWDGVLAIPEHVETVSWAEHSKEQLSWTEGNELFSVKSSIRGTRTSNQHQRGPGQRPARPSQQ